MGEPDWHKIKSVFAAAIELEGREREAYLAEACADNETLDREVRSLLAAADEPDNLIKDNALDFNSTLAAESTNYTDKHFGNYRIVREIGSGGMGTVFLATRDDGEFTMQVALKIVRQTFADSELLRRFKDERQILAKLQHPNIASLIDGGVSVDGQPFLAMEYVDGIAITEFCGEQNLTLKERLKLFLKVCKGVAFAHRNLVVHRDIKPSNILVNNENEPKLLDFGLAKLMSENSDSSQTKTAFRALTPAYASPEQLKGETITTASDIYSLGIVLYEILTGTRPFQTDGKSLEEIIRTVTQFEPDLPSAVVSGQWSVVGKSNPQSAVRNPQLLKGDLDNVILMSLRKEPERRYSSVEEFAKDIENYLDGLPVIARPNTVSYRAEKFFKRNLAASAVGALLVLSLIGGLFISLRQTNIAYASQAKAETETAKSNKIAKFMEKVLNYANPAWYAEGSKKKGEAKLIEVIDDLSDKIQTEFPDDLDIQAELHHKFAEIYTIKQNNAKSLYHAEKALELRRRVYGEKHAEVAKDLYYLSAAKSLNRNTIDSVKLSDQAIEMFHEVAPDNANLPYLLEDTANDYFWYYSDTEKAEKYLTEALEIFRRKDGENHYNTARLFIDLSKVFAKKGDLAKSDEFYRESEKRFKQLPDENLRQSFILHQANVLRAKGDFAGVEKLLENRLAELNKNGESESNLAVEIRGKLHDFYEKTDNFKKLTEYAKLVVLAESRKPIPNKDSIVYYKAVIAYSLLRSGKESEAKPIFEEAFQAVKESAKSDKWLDESYLGRYLFYLKRYREAEPFLKNGLDGYNANVPPGKDHRELAEMLDKIKPFLKE